MFRNKRTILMVLVLTLALFADVANADYTFGTPTNLGPTVNSSGYDFSPSIPADGLEMYFESNRPGGAGTYDIWVSTRANKEDDWGAPTDLGAPINTPDWQNSPCISADGLELYFNDWGLWVVRRATVGDPWGEPENHTTSNINAIAGESPCLSSDGLSLFLFSWDETDLYVSTRLTRDDLWSEPVNLGPTVNGVNSTWENSDPTISADGLVLLFSSIRPGVSGGTDLWMTRRSTIDGPWSEPVNLGPTINGDKWDGQPEISADGRTLLFCSNRDGGHGDYDIWQASIDPVVDLNGDGIVDVADVFIMLEHWHTDYSLCDIGPMPWGDGFVDAQDLKVLTEHLSNAPRPIANWRLDEDDGSIACDSAGNYDADLHGGPLWQPAGGKEGGALQFDGVDDYVSTPFILDPAKGSFSVFAWIKSSARGQVIIAQNDATGTRWLWTDPSYGRLTTWLMHPPFDPLMSQSRIADGQWHHIGLVYDFEALHRYLYIDGREAAEDTAFVGGVNSSGGLYFGAEKTLGPGTFFSGLIDDVRIYNNVLSAEEIAVLAK